MGITGQKCGCRRFEMDKYTTELKPNPKPESENEEEINKRKELLNKSIFDFHPEEAREYLGQEMYERLYLAALGINIPMKETAKNTTP